LTFLPSIVKRPNGGVGCDMKTQTMYPRMVYSRVWKQIKVRIGPRRRILAADICLVQNRYILGYTADTFCSLQLQGFASECQRSVFCFVSTSKSRSMNKDPAFNP